MRDVSDYQLSAEQLADAVKYDERIEAFDGEPLYFDRQGEPISFGVFFALWRDFLGYRLVASTHVAEGVVLTTIWLGLDDAFMEPGPIIFESMLFIDGEASESYGHRTEAEAIERHDEIAADVRERLTLREE